MLSDNGILAAMYDDQIDIYSPTLSDHQVQANSIDLHLSPYLLIFDNKSGLIDLRVSEDFTRHVHEVEIDVDDVFILAPGQFVLGSTVERLTFGTEHAGMLEGKSSLGRIGLEVHSTAGFFDAGFHGYPTLEISSRIQQHITLYPGMPVCQMAFFKLDSGTTRPYNGKYVDQGSKPKTSEYWRNTWKDPRE